MNKILLLSILIFGIFVISGCSKAVIDCGTDTTCFMKNFKTCTPSKVLGGSTVVKGGTPKSCQVYFEGDNPTYKDGKIVQGEKMSMECEVPDTNMFEDELFNGFTILKIADISSCKGTFYDSLVPSLNIMHKTANSSKKA